MTRWLLASFVAAALAGCQLPAPAGIGPAQAPERLRVVGHVRPHFALQATRTAHALGDVARLVVSVNDGPTTAFSQTLVGPIDAGFAFTLDNLVPGKVYAVVLAAYADDALSTCLSLPAASTTMIDTRPGPTGLPGRLTSDFALGFAPVAVALTARLPIQATSTTFERVEIALALADATPVETTSAAGPWSGTFAVTLGPLRPGLSYTATVRGQNAGQDDVVTVSHFTTPSLTGTAVEDEQSLDAVTL